MVSVLRRMPPGGRQPGHPGPSPGNITTAGLIHFQAAPRASSLPRATVVICALSPQDRGADNTFEGTALVGAARVLVEKLGRIDDEGFLGSKDAEVRVVAELDRAFRPEPDKARRTVLTSTARRGPT